MLTQKYSVASVILATLLGLMTTSSVSAGPGKLLDQTGHSCCPVCDHKCNLDVEEIEVDKTCFEVESKVICIPRVVFPWQKAKKTACASCDSCDGRGCTSCVHNGARVRKICVAKAKKYKCPACKYTWTAEKKESCGGGCDLGCADMSGVGMPSVPVDSVAAPVDAAPETWMTEEGYTATLIEPNATANTSASGLESVQVEPADAMPPAPKPE